MKLIEKYKMDEWLPEFLTKSTSRMWQFDWQEENNKSGKLKIR